MKIQPQPPQKPNVPPRPSQAPAPSAPDSFVESAATAALPVAGALLGGIPGALAGGAASTGVRFALHHDVGAALKKSALPTALACALGATGHLLPPAARIGVGLALAAGIGLADRPRKEEAPPNDGLVHINRPGEAVELEKSLVPGKKNIVFMGASWCEGCEHVSGPLAEYARQHPDTVVLKIDIRDWESPVAHQFNLSSIPAFQIFDEAGKLVAQGDEARAQVKQQLS